MRTLTDHAHTPGQETFDIRPGCRIYKEYVSLMDYAEMLDIVETLQEVISGYITQKGPDGRLALAPDHISEVLLVQSQVTRFLLIIDLHFSRPKIHANGTC